MVAGAPRSSSGPLLLIVASPAPAGCGRPRLPDCGASCDDDDDDGNVLTVSSSIGTLSLSHVNVSGRSPVTTTHCTLVRSPTFKSRAKLKGVILGGTEKNNTDKVAFHQSSSDHTRESRCNYGEEQYERWWKNIVGI